MDLKDVFCGLKKIYTVLFFRHQAVYSATSSCCVCGSALRGKLRNVVFSCHHAFHVECADRCGGVALSSTGEEIWSCVVCLPNVNQVKYFFGFNYMNHFPLPQPRKKLLERDTTKRKKSFLQIFYYFFIGKKYKKKSLLHLIHTSA